MPKTDEKVIAILCADIHLSIKAPVWRSTEEDWFAAMKRPLDELRELQSKYDCPILCAGDIFDKWNSPPEIINFALKYLPERMYCIPGQHDLPDHNYSEIHRSAYWTLVKAGKIYRDMQFNQETIVSLHDNLLDNKNVCVDNIRVYGFPYGHALKPCIGSDKNHFHIALIHEYKWIKNHSYPNAPIENKITPVLSKSNYGYDIIVYGDNHNGFLYANMAGTAIFNCGCLMRRKSDEIDYKPQVGLLYADGKIGCYYLQTANDKFLANIDDATAVEKLDIEEFLEELKKLGDTSLEFTTAIERFFKKHKTHPVIQKIIRKAGEE